MVQLRACITLDICSVEATESELTRWVLEILTATSGSPDKNHFRYLQSVDKTIVRTRKCSEQCVANVRKPLRHYEIPLIHFIPLDWHGCYREC